MVTPSAFTQWFTEGGPVMYVITALDLFGSCVIFAALILALAARFAGKAPGVARVVAVLAFIGCIIPLCTGFVGYSVGNYQVKQAVEYADPAQQDALYEAGKQQSGIPLRFGGCSTLCCGFPALIALLIVPRRKRGWEQALEDV